MKNLYFILISLFVLFVVLSCNRKSIRKDQGFNPQDEKTLLDSLEKTDSIVSIEREENPHLAVSHAKQALSYALITHIPSVVVKANSIVGSAYILKQKDSSFFYYSEGLKLANRYGVTNQLPAIYCNLSKIYAATSVLKTSVFLLDSAKRLATQTRNWVVLSDAYNELGNISNDVSNSAQAKKMFDSAFLVAQRHSINVQMGIALGSMASVEDDVEKSISLGRQAITYLRRSPGTKHEIASIFINIAAEQKNQDSIITYALSALAILKGIGLDDLTIAAQNLIAYAYMEKSEYRTSEYYLIGKAIPLAKQNNNFDWLTTLFDTYSALLIRENKMGEAALVARKSLEYKRKADVKLSSEQVRLLSAVLDSKTKEIRLGIYDKQVQMQQDKIQAMWLFIAALVFTVLILSLIALSVFQKNKLKTQKQLVESAKTIISIEESWSERLSMELHDLTSPLYSSMIYEIEAINIPDSSIKKELQMKLSLLSESIRQISHKMNKGFIDQFSFGEQMEGLIENMQRITRLQIEADIIDLDGQLSSESAAHILRIVQELLSNAVKYIEQGNVTLKIFKDKKVLKLIYSDTGDGFDQEETEKHGLGIKSINERARLLGGTAKLISKPGLGTHWYISIPV